MPISRPALLLLLLVVTRPAPAADADILTRLMNEPLTLFDWGLAQLDRDIGMAATRTIPARVGVGMGELATGSIFDWRSRKISLFVRATAPETLRTGGDCSTIFQDIVGELVRGAPGGPDAAGWYLMHAFRPKAHYWGGRFEDVGAKLLESVLLEISLVPASADVMSGDTARVRCSGRLDAARGDLTVEAKS